VVAVVLFAACGLVWLIGQVAAILFGAHEHLPVRLVDMLGVLLCLPGTWDDPAKAWPPDTWPLLRGPVGMYAAAVLTFWLPALAYGLFLRLVSPRARRRRRERGARWASWWQLRRLLVLGPRRGRIILGRRDRIRDRLLGRLYLAVEQCHSVLAFGPPGSFKTHGLVIPAILEWQGNLVTTSIKPDVLRATLRPPSQPRRRLGSTTTRTGRPSGRPRRPSTVSTPPSASPPTASTASATATSPSARPPSPWGSGSLSMTAARTTAIPSSGSPVRTTAWPTPSRPPAPSPPAPAGARSGSAPNAEPGHEGAQQMAADNHTTIIGNLTDDPEVRFTVGVGIGWLSRIWAAASGDGPSRAGLTFEVL
jgi:type IV secretion system protein VirD4